MVNLPRLSALFAYDLTSVAYKPVPGLTRPDVSAGGNVTFPNHHRPTNASHHSMNSTRSAAHRFHNATASAAAALSTQEALAKNDVYYLPSLSTSAAYNPAASLNQELASDTSAGGGDCHVDAYEAPLVLDQDFPPYDQTESNVYRYRQQQAVNLGSWFVHEDWMTPSVFKCAAGAKGAEIDIANGWGSLDSARAVLEQHWDTFITQSDFDYLANIGINTVRLPIGYWSLGPDFLQGTPFENVSSVYQNSWPRVVRAVNQAGRAGLGVLIDLHGAVGSQNGQPHSGVSDGQTHLFDVAGNMDKTIDVLRFLAKTFGPVNNVVGIQLLNEPQYVANLEDFYTRAIEAIRQASSSTRRLPLYLHDGFDLGRFSNFVAARTDFIVQDHHSYFVFTESDKAESGSRHLVDVNGTIADSLAGAARTERRNLVVDEWSCALTPESLKQDDNADAIQKQFGLEQIKVYTNATAGWSFWSYKKEDCDTDPGWCFKAAVGRFLPDTFFSYGRSTSMKEASALAKEASNIIIPTDGAAGVLNLVPQQPFAYQGDNYPRDIPHRFAAIHDYSRRDQQVDDAMRNSTLRGYKDGFTTAKVFAAYNMSRLGFVGQYMADAIAIAGPSLIVQGTEDGYRGAFMEGLQHGEAAIMSGK